MREISIAAQHIAGQPMFKLIDKVKHLEVLGRDIIHLEIGDPDFKTPNTVIEAAKNSLDAGETHYGSSWGLPEFIEAIRQTTRHSRGFTSDVNQVLVTPGANIAIYYAAFCLCNPSNEILIPDPGFPTYRSAVGMCGAIPVPYPLHEKNAFRIRVEDIEPLITERTRLLLINSPQNPTGAITEPSELKKIFDLAVKYDLYIYSDEIYARMVYDKQDFFSIASIDGCKERVILSNGFSKAFAMTGWRLGAVIAPPEVAERMMLLLQTTSSCVSTFIQRAGLEAVSGDQKPVQEMLTEYKIRRELLVNGLNEIPGISCHMPGGAFYAFPNISSFGMSSDAFAETILERCGVALLPGSNFGEQGEGFVRICYASSRENIKEALKRLTQVCKTL